MNVELVNAVAGEDLGIPLDLHDLSFRLSQYSPNYEPEVSPGLYFKLPNTEVTVMIFGSGKYHLTGGDSIDQIHEANKELINIFECELNLDVNHPKPEIRNLVYRGQFDREFDLEALASDLPDTIEFRPEGQPGLRYRSDSISGVITVFRTGGFTIIGVKSESDAFDVLEEFRSQISALMPD